jgi:hypothetical protein
MKANRKQSKTKATQKNMNTNTNQYENETNNQINIKIMNTDFNSPSLCIPLVCKYIKEHDIRKVMNELNLGVIDKIDIVSVRTRHKQPQYQSSQSKPMNRVFIHYKTWGTGPNARNARELLLKGKEIKVIYDELWFWKISLCREKEKERYMNNITTSTSTSSTSTSSTSNSTNISNALLTYLEKRKKINNMNEVTNRYMFFYEIEGEEEEGEGEKCEINVENYYAGMSNIPPKKNKKNQN